MKTVQGRGRFVLRLLIGLSLIGLCGCASVSFHADPEAVSVDKSADRGVDSRKDAGFLFYPPKPYLAVEPGEKGSVFRVVMLPNMNKAMRVRQNPGWGATQFSFSTTNGMITTFNASNDSKAAETLGALLSGAGSVLNGYGTVAAAGAASAAAQSAANAAIIQAVVGAIGTGSGVREEGSRPRPMVIEPLKAAGEELKDAAGALRAAATEGETPRGVADRLSAAADAIDEVAANVRETANLELTAIQTGNPSLEEIITAYDDARKRTNQEVSLALKQLEPQVAEVRGLSVELRGKSRSRIITALVELDQITKKLAAYAGCGASGVSGPQLFEIEMPGGKLALKPVVLP